VTRLAGERAGVTLTVDGSDVRCDGAVLATPPAAAAAVLAHEATSQWLAAVPTRPAVAVVLWLSRRVPTESFGFSFPRLEPPGDVLAAICVQGRKLEFEPGTGDAVVAFPAPAYVDTNPDDATLEAAVPHALELPLPGITKVTEAVEVHRLAGGYRQFPPGYITALGAAPLQPLPGIALAGDYLVAPTVEGAVRSGLRAAALLLATSPGA
jgi:oxygen-dependent protoporphyrinogen oxidase